MGHFVGQAAKGVLELKLAAVGRPCHVSVKAATLSGSPKTDSRPSIGEGC